MKVVIDTNIVMAMLIKPGVPLKMFFKEKLEIFAPDLLLIELERNKELLARKTGLDETEIDDKNTIAVGVFYFEDREKDKNYTW